MTTAVPEPLPNDDRGAAVCISGLLQLAAANRSGAAAVRKRYGEYADLRKLVHRTLRRTDQILVIGCGNSNFSAELYDDGFEEVRNSTLAPSKMRRRHRGDERQTTNISSQSSGILVLRVIRRGTYHTTTAVFYAPRARMIHSRQKEES